MRIATLYNLAVQFQHQTQHAVGGGVLATGAGPSEQAVAISAAASKRARRRRSGILIMGDLTLPVEASPWSQTEGSRAQASRGA